MIADDCGVNIDFPEHIAEKVGRAEGEYLHWTISDLIFIFVPEQFTESEFERENMAGLRQRPLRRIVSGRLTYDEVSGSSDAMSALP